MCKYCTYFSHSVNSQCVKCQKLYKLSGFMLKTQNKFQLLQECSDIVNVDLNLANKSDFNSYFLRNGPSVVQAKVRKIPFTHSLGQSFTRWSHKNGPHNACLVGTKDGKN